MRSRSQRRQLLLVLAILLVVAVPSVASWQMGVLGAGLVAIGVVLILQSRRRSPH